MVFTSMRPLFQMGVTRCCGACRSLACLALCAGCCHHRRTRGALLATEDEVHQHGSVGAVWFRYKSRLHQMWRSWLLVAVVCGIACSLAMALAANARRAESALTRAFAVQHGADAVVDADASAIGSANVSSYLAAVDAMPEVSGSAHLGGVFLEEVTDGKIADALNTGSASAKLLDQAAIDTIGRFRLLQGRYPATGRADEVLANPELLQLTGWKVGDAVSTLRIFRVADMNADTGEADPTKGDPTGPLRIVGVARRPEEFLDASDRQPQLYLYPAFGIAHPDAALYTNDFVTLKGGQDAAPAFRAKVQSLASTYENNAFYFVSMGEGIAKAQEALRPQVVAWFLLAAVSFVAALVLVAQSIGRKLFADNRDYAHLHGLGMTRGDLTATAVIQSATIATASVVIAVALALVSSRLTPLGSMHDVDPDRGWRADWWVLAGGGLVTLLSLIGASWWSARRVASRATSTAPSQEQRVHERPSRVVGFLAGAGLPPTLVVGSGFALHAGRDRAAARVRGVIASAIFAVGVLMLAVAFTGNLHHLVTTPRLYGWNWDVGIINAYGSIPDDAITQMEQRPEVSEISAITYGTVTIDGHSVPAVGVDQVRGTVFPTLNSGRPPLSDNDIVLGRLTLNDLHRSVGDFVNVHTATGDHRLFIVGVATFPELGPNRFSGTALGRGAAMTVNVLPTINDQFGGRYNGTLIRLNPHLDRQTTVAALRAFVRPLGCDAGCFVTDLRPSQLQGYSDLGNIWLPFVIVLGLLFAISLAHGILWSAAVRTRDLRILTALGFDRVQIAVTLAWQALTIATIALALGTAVGLVSSNAGWRLFTERFGIDPGTWGSARELGIIWATVLVCSVLVGLCAVPAASRVRELR
ncbi:MAG: putative transport system permease protein [Ilumatobacteraceae bacterium]|nr:putative transport system permease protein [Ilumatobacteraceae bacterium]